MASICVVDDSPVVTTQVLRLLGAVGLVDAKVFNEPDTALQWCLANTPPVVLLDYSMPQMDGLEFLRRLKRHPQSACSVVAMMTGWETPLLRKRALEEGAVAVIAKPFGGREFQDFVLALKAAAEGGVKFEAKAGSQELETQWPLRDERNTFELSRLLHEFTLCNPPLICSNGSVLRKLVLSMARACDMEPVAVGVLDAALRRTLRLGMTPFTPDGDDLDREALDRRLGDLARAALELLPAREDDALKMCAQMVVFGQERWDGSGWPLGSRGLAIPLAARVFSVANQFALLVSPDLGADRPVPVNLLLDVMDAGAGKEFDPAMVRALRVVASAVLLEN